MAVLESRVLEDALSLSSLQCITATSRLAQDIRRRHATTQHAQGRQQCPAPMVSTFDQWLFSQHETLSLLGHWEGTPLAHLVLTAEQSLRLWEQVITQDMDRHEQPLFDVDNLARTAQEAHELMVIWQVPVKEAFASAETQVFMAWRSKYLAKCHRHHWIDRASVLAEMAAKAEHWLSQIQLPAHLAFAGFSRYNPVEERLQAALAAAGVSLLSLDMSRQTQPLALSVASYPDAEAELLAAAHWAKAQLATSPEQRVALVVPDLNKRRNRLQDVLDDVLLPQAICADRAEVVRPFNISLGRPLAQCGLVASALNVLQLASRSSQITLAQFSQLMRDPFWSHATSEFAQRAQADAQLRRRARASHALKSYLAQAKYALNLAEGAVWPQWYRHGLALSDLTASLSDRRLPSAWVKPLLAALEAVGWLSERALSSAEYQMQQAFFMCLQRLAQFDLTDGKISYDQALKMLRQLCAQQIFQEKTRGNPRLQVLGLLEMSGLQADAVWVMGMTDVAWPMPARPNPLLDSAEQRACQSPAASAQVQWQFATALQAHINQCALDVCFSWPLRDGSTELSPSALLPAVPVQDCQAPHALTWARAAAQSAGQALAAPMLDDAAPAVLAGDKVPGGTGLLKAQAICPAWAFFEYRLGAKALEMPEEGIDAAQKGTLVHLALQFFWGEIKTSQSLRALSDAALRHAISQAVAAALREQAEDPKQRPLAERERALEQQRMEQLLLAWMPFEKARDTDFQVLAREHEMLLTLDGIQVRTIIDRIDELADGTQLIIDYKTGNPPDIKNWASSRLTEPQLPLYAALTATQARVAGLAFAALKPEKMAWQGLTEADEILPKVKGFDQDKLRELYPSDRFPDWDAVLTHWQDSLLAIAQEIQAGEAGVVFSDEALLKYAPVKALLRLREREQQWRDGLGMSEECAP